MANLSRIDGALLKQCSKCKNLQDIDQYGKATHHSDGLKSNCKSCESAWHAANYKKNPKVRARNAAWALANPEKRRDWQRRDMRDNPDKYRSIRLKHTFGITLERYNQMISDQSECCAICQRHQSEFKKSLCVDHNHKTGAIRKLLCANCNHALGLIREDKKTARRLLAYIVADQTAQLGPVWGEKHERFQWIAI